MAAQTTGASKEIAEQVIEAHGKRSGLQIRGSGSKQFLVNPVADTTTPLELSGYSGVVDPPAFGSGGTLGGVIACGASGPSRPYQGAARDFMLGTRIVNGKGEILRFGGEVMKNVAGYDVSRLQVGALGSLGVLLDVSLKVLPLAEQCETRCFEKPASECMAFLQSLTTRPVPLAASAVLTTPDSGVSGASGKVAVRVRLSGSAAAVSHAGAELGGDTLPQEEQFWASLRDLNHEFFTPSEASAEQLWRITLPPATPLDDFVQALPGSATQAMSNCLCDWGGGLRWIKSEGSAEHLCQAVGAMGGQLQRCAWPGGSADPGVSGNATIDISDAANGEAGYGERFPFANSDDTLVTLQRGIKSAFDPENILNPGVFGY